ncbi:hypothetical protein BDV27DRAFT_71162 [Aspergillus caelatus]|uniref:Uncharacterized protein n=1 Tax=Aspergillus caelatus TaxID=61420 RepID=A0A5N6ZQ44_9EURO|nr:uncharacterized protein BDV27DRAFT_71162 [Aspergillus caelatus]KAE8358310.1 hypothetical protein BDV27DRAFT_71162 [Aspergillus caelatus]
MNAELRRLSPSKYGVSWNVNLGGKLSVPVRSKRRQESYYLIFVVVQQNNYTCAAYWFWVYYTLEYLF